MRLEVGLDVEAWMVVSMEVQVRMKVEVRRRWRLENLYCLIVFLSSSSVLLCPPSQYHNKVTCFMLQQIEESCSLGAHAAVIIPPTWIIRVRRPQVHSHTHTHTHTHIH